MESHATDPFTREIIKEGFIAAVEESFVTLGRTSKSTIIYEVLDYACGLTDAKGDLVAEAAGVPGFIGLLSFAVKEALEKYGVSGIAEGDVILTNSPYASGTHLSDVSMCMPILFKNELLAFSVNKAHWTEVGGRDPGSWTTDSTEIYQEGLQFPSIKLYDEGQRNESLVDLIRANVRLPTMSLGDLHAQVAALKRGAYRTQALCEKYGQNAVLETIRWYMEYGERVTREEMRRLPKGVFRAEDWMDDDGLSDEPIVVKVKVTITDEAFVVDFADTSPQSPGPVNSTLPATISAVREVFKAVTDPHQVMNEGCFRPLEVRVPEGCILNAAHPAPTSIYWESMIYASDVVWKALALEVPDRLPAGHFLSSCGTIISGREAGGGMFLLVEPQAGGWGASHRKDGERGLVVSSDGDTFVIPVEVCERRYPLRVEQFAFNLEEGGHGAYRGGNGLVRDYRILSPEALVTATFGRFRYPPWGMAGGQDGTCNRIEFHLRDRESPEIRGKAARVRVGRGDLVRLITGVGGGYGDPMKRDPKRVVRDIIEGFITPTQATEVYGVRIVDEEGSETRWKPTPERTRRAAP